MQGLGGAHSTRGSTQCQHPAQSGTLFHCFVFLVMVRDTKRKRSGSCFFCFSHPSEKENIAVLKTTTTKHSLNYTSRSALCVVRVSSSVHRNGPLPGRLVGMLACIWVIGCKGPWHWKEMRQCRRAGWECEVQAATHGMRCFGQDDNLP